MRLVTVAEKRSGVPNVIPVYSGEDANEWVEALETIVASPEKYGGQTAGQGVTDGQGEDNRPLAEVESGTGA